jgi:hypothetical protein
VVITYAEGLGDVPNPSLTPPLGGVASYDVATRHWLYGPTAPRTGVGSGAYWTRYGVVTLGQFNRRTGGWLLRPAR